MKKFYYSVLSGSIITAAYLLPFYCLLRNFSGHIVHYSIVPLSTLWRPRYLVCIVDARCRGPWFDSWQDQFGSAPDLIHCSDTHCTRNRLAKKYITCNVIISAAFIFLNFVCHTQYHTPGFGPACSVDKLYAPFLTSAGYP